MCCISSKDKTTVPGRTQTSDHRRNCSDTIVPVQYNQINISVSVSNSTIVLIFSKGPHQFLKILSTNAYCIATEFQERVIAICLHVFDGRQPPSFGKYIRATLDWCTTESSFLLNNKQIHRVKQPNRISSPTSNKFHEQTDVLPINLQIPTPPSHSQDPRTALDGPPVLAENTVWQIR